MVASVGHRLNISDGHSVWVWNMKTKREGFKPGFSAVADWVTLVRSTVKQPLDPLICDLCKHFPDDIMGSIANLTS